MSGPGENGGHRREPIPTLFVKGGRESIVLSVVRDSLSFGMLIATAWVLNTQMPPSAWLNAALAEQSESKAA